MGLGDIESIYPGKYGYREADCACGLRIIYDPCWDPYCSCGQRLPGVEENYQDERAAYHKRRRQYRGPQTKNSR